LSVAYDGSDFAGFQFQPKVRTVQGELEKAAARVLLPAGRVVGARIGSHRCAAACTASRPAQPVHARLTCIAKSRCTVMQPQNKAH
jgi:tRNA pseudouridine(38-40) synthase